jgi:hypothetical protein
MPNQAWLDSVLDLLIQIEKNTENKKPTQDYDIIDAIRENFLSQIACKTVWRRNDIEIIFEKSISGSLEKGDTLPWQP